MERLPFILAHYTAVGHYRHPVNEAEMAVDICVVGHSGKQFPHPLYLVLRFVQVCVQIHSGVDMPLIKLPGKL